MTIRGRTAERVRPNVGLAAVFFFGMICCLSVSYGFQYRVTHDRIFYFFLAFSLFFVAFAIGGLLVFLRRPADAMERQANLRRLSLFIAVAALVLTLYFNSDQFPISGNLLALAVLGGIPAIVMTAGDKAAISAVLVAGLTAFLIMGFGAPLDVAAANMLPIIEAGCRVLFQGGNPYEASYPGIASAPVFYLPGLFLPYCLPVAAGLDVRVVNAVALLLILVLAFRWFGYRAAPEAIAIGLAPLLLSPPAGQMMIHGHLWVYWLEVLGLVYAVDRRRYLIAAILLGLMLATRQMALAIAVPVAGFMLARLGPREVAKYAAATVATWALIMAPVLLTTPGVLEMQYAGISDAGRRVYASAGNPFNQVALSGIALMTGSAALLVPLQALIIGSAGLAAALRGARLPFSHALFWLGVVDVVAISLNEFLHRYFYFEGLLLIGLALAYAAQARAALARPAST